MSALLIQVGGPAAGTAGVLFVVWGYIDGADASRYVGSAVSVLAVLVPVLFLLALVGLYARYRGMLGWIGGTGFVLGFFGAVSGAVRSVVDSSIWYGYVAGHGWSPQLLNWFPWLLAGLTLLGVSRAEALRSYTGPLLAMALSGWAYYFTDSYDGTVGVRLAHVLFGLLFSLGWMALGCALWLESRSKRCPSR